MAKIVIIGAGSGFGSRLSIDILARPSLADSTIALCDIHEGRLRQVHDYVQRAIDVYGLPGTVVAGTCREELLPEADCVVTAVSVGGPAYWGEPYKSEVEIPLRYGVVRTVADTVGVGGVFRFLRTAGQHLQFARDYGAAVSRRHPAQLHQPDVHAHLAALGRLVDPERGAVPQRAEHHQEAGRRGRRRVRGGQLPGGRDQPPGLGAEAAPRQGGSLSPAAGDPRYPRGVRRGPRARGDDAPGSAISSPRARATTPSICPISTAPRSCASSTAWSVRRRSPWRTRGCATG